MKKIFFIIWGDPKFYQTLIFLSQILSKNKFKLYILCRDFKNYKNFIKKINFGNKVKIIKSPAIPFFKINYLDYIFFVFFVLFQFLNLKPKHIVFFNKKSLFCTFFLRLIKNETKFIYHNFDFELPKNIKNLHEKILSHMEFFCSNYCDYVVLPSRERSLIFKKNLKNTKVKTYYFMNCFPKNFKPELSNKFSNYLIKKKIKYKYLVSHLGSIGPSHYLENILKSLIYIEENIVLVIAGNSINGFAEKLRNIAKILKLDNRVLIIEDVSNTFWYSILANTTIGLCFYKKISTSHKYMAGTSQKFNNYLFLKKPMLVNRNSDFIKFKKNHDIFNLVNPKSPNEIAREINKLIKNKKRYLIIQNNMSKSFKKKLNFESQFLNSYEKFL